MHPEIYRELTSYRGRELRKQAQRASLAKMASRLRRAARSGETPADGFVIPAIPDYVDGSFRTETAEVAGTARIAGTAGDAASEPGRMPATGHAA
jgi:hypothetical protein